MAHGLNSVLKRAPTSCKGETKTGIGSRRIFAPHFKLQVLDSYRSDADCKGNQRATARKYGIHRRQIQKWLQVEGNLRSSVCKEAECPEAALRCGSRQRDDDGEARVPALSPAPLDFTTHSRSPPPAAPMDLSLKRPAPAAGALSAPATFCPSPPRMPSPPSLARPHPDVWDLSTKRKCADQTHSGPKPVKLFKPYLDVVEEAPPRTPPEAPPCCSYFYTNNNNNICDIKSEYATYTFHELSQKNSVNYFYSFPAAYPEYEMGAAFCAGYDEPSCLQGGVPLKQRHSYSLDFKLSAIECYYQDSVCKGNQRAVATKYNIHRRQVQKWLKQADELRQKNDCTKPAPSVR